MEEKKARMPHNLILENRHTLTLSGVSDVGGFDEQLITVMTDLGELTIKGDSLHISKLSLETGDLNVDGEIHQLSYTNVPKKGAGLFSRMFQ